MIDLWPLPVLWAMAISVWASFMAGVIKVIIPRGVAHTQSSSLSGSLKVQAIPATKIRRQINIVSVLYSSENITFNWISHMMAATIYFFKKLISKLANIFFKWGLFVSGLF